jgi:hypothetical protein
VSRPREAAPTPPWGAFPLVELCALAAIGLGVWGLLQEGRTRGILLTVAALLGSVAGLEVALREHLGGYRSHSLLLAGTTTVVALVLLILLGLTRAVAIPLAPVLLLAGFLGFRMLFRRRSGGAAFRVR